MGFKLESGVEKDTIFNRVNRLDQASVVRLAGLEAAADGKSYVCPICSHGKHGDGIYQQTKNSRRAHWYCFGCGCDYSNADLICEAAGIDSTDIATAARYLEEEFPEWETSFSFTVKEDAPTRSAVDNVQSGAKDYSKLYRYLEWKHPLSSYLKIGEKWRGLEYRTLRPEVAPYRKAIYNPCLWLNNNRPAIMFPYDNNNNLSKSPAQAGDAVLSGHQQVSGDQRSGFFWRSLVDERKGFSKGFKFQPYIVSTIKMGSGAINFVFEGIINALSVLQAVNETRNAEWLKNVGLVATGSASNAQKFVEWVGANYNRVKDKPRFCIIADNDERGLKAAGVLWTGLNERGFATAMKQFASRQKPKMDANDVLQGYKAAKLFDIMANWKVNALEKMEALK